MKVSIITATYNSGKTIQDTLESLSQQTYTDIEHIIVDGASTDNTVSLIRENGLIVSKLISEPDEGIYDALNKGIEVATGDIIGFLHSDDLFAYPSALDDIVQTISREGTDAVYADLEYVTKHNTSKVVRKWISGTYNREKLRSGWMPPHPTFFMKRDLYHKHGGFDLDYKISADYDSILRYLWHNNVSVSYFPKVITKMRVGGASNRSLSNIITKTLEDIQVLRKNKFFWPKALFMKNISKLPQFFRY